MFLQKLIDSVDIYYMNNVRVRYLQHPIIQELISLHLMELSRDNNIQAYNSMDGLKTFSHNTVEPHQILTYQGECSLSESGLTVFFCMIYSWPFMILKFAL